MKASSANLLFVVCSMNTLFPVSEYATGEVTRFEITARSDFADGQSFGEVGTYERIEGQVYYAIDPDKPQNERIIDLQHAPRNEDGKVEFQSDVFILSPKNLSNGNGALLYDVNNRGNKMAVRFFNDSPGGNNPKSPGNGFLMRHGFTVVWSGWDGELLPGNARLQLHAPIAKDKSKEITGLVRFELVTNEKDKTRLDVNGPNHGAYRPTDNGLASATLTWRLRPDDRRVTIPRSQFRLQVSEVGSESQGQLPHVELELSNGFRAGYLYELIYEASDPLVHGVCFASVRDLISAFKHGTGENNPLKVNHKSAIKRAHGFGVSQSGRFLREMVWDGFNEDEEGHKVFDGLMPHVAGGGLGSFNHRFAQPTAYSTQHQNHDWPTDRFPFAYETQTDPLTGDVDGILFRAAAADVAPFVVHTQSATEYWSRSGSLVHTDPIGTRDAELPSNVRVFAFGGTQHGPSSYPPSNGTGQSLANPADYRPFLRALLIALDAWCRDGKVAPPSVYPSMASKTLVAFQQMSVGFPSIPGLRYPEVIQRPSLLDFGPRWQSDRIIDLQPPKHSGSYVVLVPKCGNDGNELGCLLPPEVAVPLATYSGWNLRTEEFGAENELVGLNGSYVLLPRTEAEKESTGDPRPSIESRYASLDDYVKKLEKNCNELVARGCLLSEDVPGIIKREKDRAESVFAEIRPVTD